MAWLDILGWVGSALLIYSLMQARVLRFRLLNLVACIVLVIFNGLLGIWPMVAPYYHRLGMRREGESFVLDVADLP